MIDPSEGEMIAMRAAAIMGGEYLDSIGKSDLAELSEEEYMTFIQCVCTEFWKNHVAF